jgi:hypothetical protein
MIRLVKLAAASFLCAALLLGQQAPSADAAKKAAEEWLALIDSGKYGESYDAAASAFKSAVTRDNWISSAKSVRDQTGALKSRKLRSAEYTESLPNAPAGKYVLIEYDTEFPAGPGD